MSFDRFLLVRLSALGDCLHAVPALVALRRQRPDAFVGWAIQSGGYELLRGHPMVDRFHLFPRRRVGTRREHYAALVSFFQELRSEGYYLVFDFQGNSKSGMVARASGAPHRLGFGGSDSRELNSLFVNQRHELGQNPSHVVDRNLALLATAGLEPSAAEWVLPSYEDDAGEVEAFLVRLGLAGSPFALVNPGTTWPTKQWSRQGFGEVSQGLCRRLGLPVVVSWGNDEERGDAEAIVAAAGSSEVHLAPPTALRELAALASRAALFVGNDTGPLHLAVALGVPSVALFGASDPLRNGPHGSAHRFLVSEIDCRPCWDRQCERGDLACLERIGSDEVLAACAEVLGRKD